MPQADNNVPFIGPRARYEVLGVQPSLLVHTMASGNLDGNLPRTAALTALELDPTVSAGKATWTALTAGGFFNFTKKAVIVEALSSGTWKIVDDSLTQLRATPSTPFRLTPGEKLQISGVATASVVARLDITKCI
jgi:hypothetical protein